MSQDKPFIHPYIPNSAPGVKAEMLKECGVESVDEFFSDVPEELRLRGELQLPPPLPSEESLRRHLERILAKNRTCRENLSFLGGGCYQHQVPAVCDEINRRSEFLTAYAGEPYDDHGRFQALFETASLMGELLEMEMVNVPTYDGFQAAATAIRMAARMTGRPKALVARTVNPDKLSKIRDYALGAVEIMTIGFEGRTGELDLAELKKGLDQDTAAVYLDNPSFLGTIEGRGREIAEAAHRAGAEMVVGVDPTSLGVLTPPVRYGADIVCGDLQPLGMHLNFGGGQAGFIATRDEERYVMEYPSRLFGLAPTRVEGEYGFGDVAWERTSFALREKGREWVGTASALWGITAGVYLALMGPKGMAELGEGILQRSRYLALKLNQLAGVRAPALKGASFKEFVVDFRETGRRVAEINAELLERGIFGGLSLSPLFPELENCALYCVTEVHTQADLDGLAEALKEILG